MSEPLVSILIPCFNCAAWVSQAIRSALNQTWPQKEILVIDDGSSDDSWQVISSFGRVIRAERQPNRGLAVTRSRLLALSRGAWIQCLDADDELAPDKLERQLEHRHSADVLYGSMRLEWFEGRRPVRTQELRAQPQADLWAGWFRWNYPNPSACLFRRDSLEQINGWDPCNQTCEDYRLLKKLLFAGARLMATPAAWSIYRQWSPTQIVNKSAIVLAETRLELMLEAAKQLDAQKELNSERRQAFQDSAFTMVRNLYKASPESGTQAWQRLQNEMPPFDPPVVCAPAAYRFLYRWFGFAAAEKVAGWRRRTFPAPAAGA